MQTGLLSDVLLPLAIALMMVLMGTTLTGGDFRRVLSEPKPIATGLLCQLIVLPLIGFGVASVFGLETVFAVGMVLLASSPGGSMSNLIIHVSDGDRPLSLTLTGLSNIVVFVALPIYLGIAQDVFGTLDGESGVPVGELAVQIAALTIVPIAIGMFLRAKRPDMTARWEDPGKKISTIILFTIIGALVIQNWGEIVDKTPEFGPAFITMNLLALAAGFGIATGLKINRRQSMTIAIETGIQNSALAIAIAISIFDSDDLAIVPGLYGLWMLFTGFGFAFFMQRRDLRAIAV